MDEAAVAAIKEDGADKRPNNGDATFENNVGSSAEDTADGVGVFCCHDCGEAFREEDAYLEHRHQHLQESVYLNGQLDGLNDGEKDSEAANFCTLCSISFVEASDFHSHMEKNHSQSPPNEPNIKTNPGITKQRTYKCPDCGKCYGVLGHFLNHQRSHRLASKSVFHDLEHLKKKSFQCESCGRNYSRASALDAHRRCHEGKLVKSRNRALGDVCHTEESIAEAKPSEIQTDDAPEKLFECSCGKAFTALLRLKTHQRFSRNSQCTPEEMNEKPKKSSGKFHCSECKKAFAGHIALYNHQRWHANHSNDSAQRFPCEECGKVFMTLTFYYRHQRMVHSDETPAKSFDHQVCQLQKKAFECKDCGLKFSRASALHSHQLHHTDVFRETEKEAQLSTSLLPQPKTLEIETKETEEKQVECDNLLPTSMAEEDSLVNETDEDMESYEPGDFDVLVISASESEDEPVRDLNPDLELLCESDQELREDDDTVVSPSNAVSKPEMDLKIVQIDFELADVQRAPIAREDENKTTEERFDCPECYRWFSSASSLRVHRMWHGIRKRRRQNQGQSVAVYTCDTCFHEDSSYAAHCSHIQQHKNENTSNDVSYPAEGSEKKNLSCSECGKCFSRLSALVSHQLHHPKRKQFQCPDCMMSYLHAASLFNHMKNCSAQKKENISVSKKEYNPKKTLLGPKIYHCEQCGKGFWSLGAFSHHKQNQNECADLRLRKGLAGSLHTVNGHPRSSVKIACPVCGRKFRHKGIMALHMRKHENGNHKCELCNRSFRLFSSLLRHQVVHNDQLLPPPIKSFQHQVEQLKKNTYSCPDCGKLFSRAKALQFHMKSHGYETGYSPSSPRSTVTLEALQCATCLAHFNSKASLRAHQKLCIKRDNRVIDCKSDRMDVSTQGTFEQKRVNLEVNEMDCRELKNEQTGQTGGASSESLGTNDLKYKCKKCDRSFSVVGALNFHKRIHAEGYKSVENAKSSMSLIFKKLKQEEQSKGLFHCSECGRRFMSNSALGSHKRWHKEKKFSRSLLRDDLKSVSHKTEGGPFPCQNCGKQFFNLRVLQRHQTFNLQCQTKIESDSKNSVESRNSPSSKNSEFSSSLCNETFVQGSLLDAHCENERRNSLEAADHQGDKVILFDQAPEQVHDNVRGIESMSLALTPKTHQCPLCSMAFAKAKGLRAHKWQAHSKKTKGKKKVPLYSKAVSIASSSDGKKTEESPAVDSTKVTVKNSIGTGKKKVRSGTPPVKSVSSLDCGEQCSPAGSLLEHKVFMEVKHESKEENHIPETRAEVSSPLNRLLEHSAKFLFKCDKCGKAFQTEEQLGTHKTKGRSRPYCCALCCQGFWTESQLQQHLVWHDEVRCRLPNEVRYRLSAAMTSKPLKPNILSANCPTSMLDQTAVNPDSQSQSSLQCQHTGKAFLSPTALQKHKTQHSNNDSYHCSICPRTFSEIQDLIDHHQECIAHKISLTCKDCGLKFTHVDVFKTHLHQHALEEDEQVDERAQMGDDGNLGAELDSGRGDNGENGEVDIGGDADGCDTSSSSQTKPSDSIQDVGVVSMDSKSRKVYACSICGKVYSYLVSFQKHQQLHEKESSRNKSQTEENLSKYECPDCGMSFIRRIRLLAHLKAHKSGKSLASATPRCDHCGKDFTSAQSWMSHMELHEEKPFWCVHCARGFIDEEALDKHMQRHNSKIHKCNICHKSFSMATQLMNHYNTHNGVKPYQCSLCGKSFYCPVNLMAHKKMHFRVHKGSGGMSLGTKNSALIANKQVGKKTRHILTRVKENPAMDTNMEELPEMEEHVEESEHQKPCENAGFEDQSDSEEFDCGEPAHHFKSSRPPGLAGANPLELRSGTGEPQVGEELDESESQETCMHREHKYWEWECWECDMGFDEVEKLHLHYIKHATGELPILQDDTDG